jgi:AcrR family transcriptional regulator
MAESPGERVDPRIVRTRQVVYAATLEVIAESGVQQATVDRIAERSGVSRSTIYRRWPTLPQLYYEAFAQIARRSEQPVRGDTSKELLRYLDDYADRLMDREYCSVLIALLDAAWREPELADIRRRVFDEGASRAAAIVEAGIRTGCLRADLVLRDALDAIVAPFLYRRVVEQEAISRKDVRRLHSAVMARFGTPTTG